MMDLHLARKQIVLLGIGHTNAHVLRMWRMQRLDDTQLTCVSNYSVTTYSGVLPGVLAGLYPVERMEIDLVRLCASVGARLIVDHVIGLDVANQQLLFEQRPPIPFDVLSIGIGSIPSQQGLVSSDQTVLAIKPMQTFVDRLTQRLGKWKQTAVNQPLRVTIVGAGAGGVEIAYCLPARLRAVLENVPFEVNLVTSDDGILKGMRPKTVRLATDMLAQRGVRLRCDARVTNVADGHVEIDGQDPLESDLVMWATDAAAPPLLSQLGLPLDERGFLRTQSTLQSTANSLIFAVGDSGTIDGDTTPKAGVYAVRQGPVLWGNIGRVLRGEPLREYRPQRGFLKLLNLGDGAAIAEYGGLTFHGTWCWKLKDAIDGRFMDKYQNYEPMEMDAGTPQPAAMRCAGCGGKISGSVLSRVLSRLDIPSHENVLLGLEAPDDAAIVTAPHGNPLTVTVDFFAAPLDDPYLVGRIAALNAASDVYAIGGNPIGALAMCTVPLGHPRSQEQVLYEVMAGAVEEFRRMNATLVGGHTIEGPRLTVGFTVLADQGRGVPCTKGRLRNGDCLVLTKPLGTGVLLAAHMQAGCRAAWLQPLLQTMLHSNQHAARLAYEYQIAAVTDVTGFGLAGHLLEMLQASQVAARLELNQIPLLPGTVELVEAGIESTLAPANRNAEQFIDVSDSLRRRPQYIALFDPQTSGGLLLGVPQDQLANVLDQANGQAEWESVVIGQVVEGRGLKVGDEG